MAAGEQHPTHTQPQPEERMAGEVGAEVADKVGGFCFRALELLL